MADFRSSVSSFFISLGKADRQGRGEDVGNRFIQGVDCGHDRCGSTDIAAFRFADPQIGDQCIDPVCQSLPRTHDRIPDTGGKNLNDRTDVKIFRETTICGRSFFV